MPKLKLRGWLRTPETIAIHCPRSATPFQRHRAEELLREKFEDKPNIIASIAFDADEFWVDGKLFFHTSREFKRIFTGD